MLELPPEMASKGHVMAIDGRKAFAFSTYSNDASHMQLAVNIGRTVALIYKPRPSADLV